LAEAIENSSKKYNFELWAYVFMPEHVHLLIFPTEDNYSISKILQSVKLSVSRKMINYLRKNQPQSLSFLATDRKDKQYMFWQDGGGYDRNIYSKDAVENSINYIQGSSKNYLNFVHLQAHLI
jgi:putative transposase